MASKQPVKKKEAEDFKKKLPMQTKLDLVNKLKEENNLNGVKDKDLDWYIFPECFHDAIKIPGMAKGYFSMGRGKSDTGKSNLKIHLIVEAQRQGDLPIIYETESNFPWEFAKRVGMQFDEVWEDVEDEETGETVRKVVDHTGFFIFYDNVKLFEKYGNIDHTTGERKSKPTRRVPVIEDIAYSMSEYRDMQEDGTLPMNIVAIWDAVGSIGSYRCATAKINNPQYDAYALNNSFKTLINNRIPSSRKETSSYYFTFLAINKIWIDNMQIGGPIVKNSNGEGFYSAARIVIHMGGVVSSAVESLKAVSSGRTYNYGTQTKIKVVKNHITGVAYEGKICCTSHGFWSPDKLDDYKKQYGKFLLEKINEFSGKEPVNDENDIVLEKEIIQEID